MQHDGHVGKEQHDDGGSKVSLYDGNIIVMGATQ